MVFNIIGHWKLNEASGATASDSTGNGNDGAVTGTNVEPGIFNNSRVFYKNSEDRVEVADVDILKFRRSDFTVSALIKKGNVPSYAQGVLSKWDATTGNKAWRLIVQTDGTVDFDVSSDGSSTTQSLSSPLAVTDGEWHLLTVTRDGTKYKLYIDGGLTDSDNFGPAALFPSTAPLAFGNYSESAEWDSSFDGYIDNVRIYDYTLNADEVSELMYDTGYDRFPPWFVAVSPEEDETGIPVDDPIIIRYLDEHTDLDTLNMTLNTYPVITAGIIQDGYVADIIYYTEGLSDGYDGYELTIQPTSPLNPSSLFTVELDAADAYGSFTTFQYSFYTQSDYDPPPSFDNLNPLPGDVGLDPAGSLYFEFNDGYNTGADLVSGADQSSLTVYINGVFAVSGGVIQAGYSGSVVVNAYDGFNVTITKDGDWTPASTLDISVNGSDLNGTPNSVVYVIKIGGGPTITNVTPTNLSVFVNINEAVSFDIHDSIFGISKEDVNVTILGTAAVTNGIAVNDHNVLFIEVQDGYEIAIGHLEWPDYTDITVSISIANRVGDTGFHNYSFYTVDNTSPVITPTLPADSSLRVNTGSDLGFTLIDVGAGVDAYSLDVTVNGVNIIVDGWAEPNHVVDYIPITDGYQVFVYKTLPFDEFTKYDIAISVDDFENNPQTGSYSFATDDTLGPIITNRLPSDLGSALPNTFIEFDLHDSSGSGVIPDLLDAYIESVPAIIAGEFQPGFTGSITWADISGNDGYHVLIDPDVLYDYDDIIDVDVSAKDAYGNETTSSYSFEIKDEFEPVLSYFVPAPGAESPLRPYIRFKIHDGEGVGVDHNTIDLTIDTTPAIVGGLPAPGFSGAVEATTVDWFDGYNVWARSAQYFAPDTEHTVIIDGYDLSGNQVHFSYQFTTTDDTTIPTFDALVPENGETGVSATTNISFEFNDNDGSTFLSNIHTLNVWIDGNLAVNNGVQTNDYVASLVENVNDGYDVQVTIPSALPEYQWMLVQIDGYDEADNFTSHEYSFRTADATPPTIDNFVPAAGAIDVATDATISFDIKDGYSGVNLDTLSIIVDGKIAVSSGIPLGMDGYDLDIYPIADGYSIDLFGSDLNEYRGTNIWVNVSDNEGNVRSVVYSFTTSDETAPYFDGINPPPYAINVDNHTDITFMYLDPASGPNLNKLSITVDGSPTVVNGVPEPGATLTTTAIQNGYLVEVGEITIGEAQEIEIILDGYDNYDNHSTLTYVLTGASIGPIFSNFVPDNDAIAQPVDVDIAFDVTDAYGIDLATLDVSFNSALAVLDGDALDGYSVTYTPITDGYHVVVTHDQPYAELDYVNVTLSCWDKHEIFGTTAYTFRIIGSLFPDFINIAPAPLSPDMPEDDNIEFDVIDLNQNGIVQDSISVYINFVPAVLNGEPQDGYYVGIEPIEDGYYVVIEHDRFEPYSRVYVTLIATNLDGKSLEYEYYYDVGEKAFPDVINQGPEPLEIDVPRDTDICFDVVDYTDVYLDSVIVTINGVIAYEDGYFLNGYDDVNSSVTPINDYITTSYPNIVPVFTPVPAYYPGAAFYNLYWDPMIGWVEEDGYLDGYDGYDGYKFDGYVDDGYIQQEIHDTIGYSFCFDRRVDFQYGTVVNVEVYSADTLGNAGTRSYFFSVISEVGPPVFEPISPYPDEEDVPRDSNISFEFIDNGGSGTNLSSLNVTIAGANAILGGVFQDGYSGNTVYDGDGYLVVIEPNVELQNYTVLNISLYGEDYVGNSTTYIYHFRTIDTDIPAFENVFPEPGALDVPTETVLYFEFNDHTGSGANLDTLRVSLQGSPVMIGAAALDGYDAEIWLNDKDGYSIQLYMPSPLPEWTDILVELSGYDNAGKYGELIYGWKTADETAPYFENIAPFFPGSKISGTGLISVDIIEPSSGLDVNSLGVTIDGTSIIDSGITQPAGYVTSLTQLTDGYQLQIQSIGPLPHAVDSDTVALWRMDSLTSTIPNATGDASLDGTAIGATSVPGMFDYARSFATIGDRIDIGTDSRLALQDFTVEAWIRPSSSSGTQVIYAYNPRQTTGLSRGMMFMTLSGGRLGAAFGDSTTGMQVVSTNSGLIPVGTYTHVAVVVSKTNNSVKFIIDGALKKTAELPVARIEYEDGTFGSPGSGLVLIGARISPFTGAYINAFSGTIDDLRFSGSARSVSDVANSYNRAQSVSFSEFDLIPVDIFARDLSGNDGYISYSFFTLDETPPVFSNLSPAELATQVDVNTNVAFDFTDTHSGPDLDTLNITIDGRLVVEDGVVLDNTTLSVSTITDGYRLEVDLDYPLPEYKNIIVTLDGFDIDPNQTVRTYQFSTDDNSEPAIANEWPLDGSDDITPFTYVTFDIHDWNGSGLDQSSVNVNVAGSDAIINGVTQPGWAISSNQTWVDGYDAVHYSLLPDSRYPLDTVIRVYVDGLDGYGNVFATDYAFITHDDIMPPEIGNLSPDPNETEVALNRDIVIGITDGYDVDRGRLDIYVNNDPAVIGGVVQPAYAGSSYGVSEIEDGYLFTLDPLVDFDFNQQITVTIDGYDSSGNYQDFEYYFYTNADVTAPVISARSPDADDIEVPINSDIGFVITDSSSGVNMTLTTVHVDSIPAVIDSVIQPGWNGSSSGIEPVSSPDGYHIVLDPVGVREFTYNQIHTVTIDGYDYALNQVHDVYSFTTVIDANAPMLANFSPVTSATEVPIDTDISFDITDVVSGVDMTRLMVYVDNELAVDSGIIQGQFLDVNGGITTIGDGYTITLDAFANFGYNQVHSVTIDGYDYAGHQSNYVYSFVTKTDVDGPIITPISPLDSVGDYPRDTNIVLQITDSESGVNLNFIDIVIDGFMAMEDGEFVPGSGFDGAYSSAVNIIDGYEITFDPTVLIEPSYTVNVVVDGYDYFGNHTHLEYLFTTTDDSGPFVFDFHPAPNSTNAENNPVHISFVIKDHGDGEVDIRTVKIEVAEEYDDLFTTIYDPGDLFQNGWTGVLDGNPDGDGYLVNAYRTTQGRSLAVYTVRVTASDDRGNWNIDTVGNSPELVGATSGAVSGDRITVGAAFISANDITYGEMVVMNNVGSFTVDGYDGDDLIFTESAGVGGTQTISLYRGSFMLERREFEPWYAAASSLWTIDLEFSDPYKVYGTVLSPSGYTISGGDFPVGVASVTAIDEDSVELLTTVPLQPESLYTVTVDSDNILNRFDWNIEDGYEDVTFTGYPDFVRPRVQSAIVSPFNINVTVIFDDYMTQNSELTKISNYLLSHGAYVTAAEISPKETDRVVLTVENMYNRPYWDLYVVGNMRDRYNNRLDPAYNHAKIVPEATGAALSGVTGKLKTRNRVRRVHEDSNSWYVCTSGGLDVVNKATLDNTGFVLDGYGYNAITIDSENVYFGANDGYSEDAYGAMRLKLTNISGNSTDMVEGSFSIPDILSNDINDLYYERAGANDIIAVATTFGATVFTDGYGVHYSKGSDISSIHVDRMGTVYLGNNTIGRVEVYYDAHINTVSNKDPDVVYSTATNPELSNDTINQLTVFSEYSIMDPGSNTIYVGTDFGLTVIHTDESTRGSSEGGGLSLTFGCANSGLTYETLGGDVSRVIAVDLNVERLQVFILTDDDSHEGGLTVMNTSNNTIAEFKSHHRQTLISRELNDVTFKNL